LCDRDMLKEKKRQIIDKLADDLSRSTIIITTSYQGLAAREVAELRRTLTNADVSFHVVKNTLACLAARRIGKEQLEGVIDGPTAMAFGYDDVARVAKVLSQCLKSMGSVVQIKGGLLGERVLSANEVIALANLPPREELIAQLIAQLQAPVRGLHNVLSSPIYGACSVLQARIRSLTE